MSTMWRNFTLDTEILILLIFLGLVTQVFFFLLMEFFISRKRKFHLFRKNNKEESRLPKESREYLGRILPFLSIIFVGISLYINNQDINYNALLLFISSVIFSLLSFKIEVFIDVCNGMWYLQQWLFNYSLLLFGIGFIFMIKDILIPQVVTFFQICIWIFLLLYLLEFIRDLKQIIKE